MKIKTPSDALDFHKFTLDVAVLCLSSKSSSVVIPCVGGVSLEPLINVERTSGAGDGDPFTPILTFGMTGRLGLVFFGFWAEKFLAGPTECLIMPVSLEPAWNRVQLPHLFLPGGEQPLSACRIFNWQQGGKRIHVSNETKPWLFI